MAVKKDERPMDRRVQKTRKYLSEALVNLILKKGYEAVTIQDIIDEANVGRSTFYAHFESKEQLLFSSNSDLSRSLLVAMNPKTKNGIDFLLLYQHAKENSKIAKAMLGEKGGDLILSHIKDVISIKIENYLNTRYHGGKVQQMTNHFDSKALASALVSYLTSWLDADMPFSPEEMARKSEELVNRFG